MLGTHTWGREHPVDGRVSRRRVIRGKPLDAHTFRLSPDPWADGVLRKPAKPQVVLITGATRGIGRVAAIELANRGHIVIATGRDEQRLESLQQEADLAGLPLDVLPLDVTDAKAAENVVAETIGLKGRIDGLVNNAGHGLWGPWEQLADDEVREVLETNFIGAARLSRLVLEGMRDRSFGTIINVGSLAGKIVLPGFGAYSATKFAMNAMSRSMRLEARRFGVRVVLLEPGIIDTEFSISQAVPAGLDPEMSPYDPVRNHKAKSGRENIPRASPGRVARRIRQVIEARRPRPRYTVGYDAWLGSKVMRIMPEWASGFVIRKLLGW